jgi:hypothetical protein
MSLSPHHNGCRQIQEVVEQDASWTQQVLAYLPSSYEQQAFTYQAFVRIRGVRCAGDLLRGLFAYVFCFGSLRQLGCWASLSGLAHISERAWGKRIRRAHLWMLWLLKEMLGDTEEVDLPISPVRWQGRILLIDSTSVRGRASEGYWRIHTSYDLLKRQIAQICFADHHMAESLNHCITLPGDILVADRGYCRPPAIQRALKAQVEIVVRLHWSRFPLYQQDGSRLDLLSWVSTLPSTPTECLVFLTPGSPVPLRLLAVRLSEAAAQRERARRRHRAQKNCSKLQASTVFMADWLLVLTSLDAQTWPSEQVLQMYRARWQIESLFKRIKQLVHFHRLASDHPDTNEAVVAILLLGWALVEQQAMRLRQSLHEQMFYKDHVDERGTPLHPISSWQVCSLLLHLLRSAIWGKWSWHDAVSPHLIRLLTSHPQQRTHQESALCQILATHLAGMA